MSQKILIATNVTFTGTQTFDVSGLVANINKITVSDFFISSVKIKNYANTSLLNSGYPKEYTLFKSYDSNTGILTCGNMQTYFQGFINDLIADIYLFID